MRGGQTPGGANNELTWTSQGEVVLVPELVCRLGASRILAANAEASGGRPATVSGNIASVMDGLIGSTQPAPAIQARITAAVAPRGAGGPTTIEQPANLQPLLNRIASLESTLQNAMASARPSP